MKKSQHFLAVIFTAVLFLASLSWARAFSHPVVAGQKLSATADRKSTPVIAPGQEIHGKVGQPLSYPLVASGNPTSFTRILVELPQGLSLNEATGEISGIPLEIPSQPNFYFYAENDDGESPVQTVMIYIEAGTSTVNLPPVNALLGNQPLSLPSHTDQGNPLTYLSSQAGVAEVIGNRLHFRGLGTATLTAAADQSVNENYEPLIVNFAVTVSEAPCFSENFSAVTEGNHTSSTGSGSSWSGNANFPTVLRAYQAGGAVRLGTSSNFGSITSRSLANVGGDVKVSLDVKGWTNVEGDLKVKLGNETQTVTYAATLSSEWETKILTFTHVPVGATLQIQTSAKRAFLKNIVVSCGTLVIWDGSAWSNISGPDGQDEVILAADYAGPPFESQTLTINSGITFRVTDYVKTGAVFNNGQIIVNNDANFVQTGAFTPGPGSSFRLRRDSQPVKAGSMVGWSSPLEGSSQTYQQFSYGKLADGVTNQSGTGTADDKFFTFANGGQETVLPNGLFYQGGMGFLFEVPADFNDSPQVFHGQFEGTKPFTGTVSYTNPNNFDYLIHAGNPYPGALSADAFLVANDRLQQAVYGWNSQMGEQFNSILNTWNRVGAVPFNSMNGNIAAGQSFFVVRKDLVSNTVQFTDAMRLASEKAHFNKNSAERLWLEIKDQEGLKSQLLLAFHPAATSDWEDGFDAQLLAANSPALFTMAGGKQLVIDTHGPFTQSDYFDLNVAGSPSKIYTISLAEKDGIFANGQAVFLKDKITGVITDLSGSSYHFTPTMAIEQNRFEILFDPVVLSSGVQTKQQVKIFGRDQVVTVESPATITKVTVYDLVGRILVQQPAKSNSVTLPVNGASHVVVLVDLANGSRVSKKVRL